MTNIYDKYLDIDVIKDILQFIPQILSIDKEKILTCKKYYDFLWYFNVLAKVLGHDNAEDIVKDPAVVLWVNMVNPKRTDSKNFCDIGLPIFESDVFETLEQQFPFHIYGHDTTLPQIDRYHLEFLTNKYPYKDASFWVRMKYENEKCLGYLVLQDMAHQAELKVKSLKNSLKFELSFNKKALNGLSSKQKTFDKKNVIESSPKAKSRKCKVEDLDKDIAKIFECVYNEAVSQDEPTHSFEEKISTKEREIEKYQNFSEKFSNFVKRGNSLSGNYSRILKKMF